MENVPKISMFLHFGFFVDGFSFNILGIIIVCDLVLVWFVIL